MTPTTSIQRPAQTEMHLAALASAVDRANRPTSLLTLPFVLLIVVVLFAAWSYRSLSGERAALRARQTQVRQIERLVAQIKGESRKEVDLEKLYPKANFLGSQVADDVWTSGKFQFSTPPTVSQISSSRVDNTSPLFRSDVSVTVNNEPIERIFEAIDATFNHEQLRGRVFITQALLTPSGTGWRATIRFSVYEKKS